MNDKSRYKDLAVLLPWLGLFLFTPPVLFLFRPSVTLAGVPLLPIYLFFTWLVLIFASRQLTKHLVEEPEPLEMTNRNTSHAAPEQSTDDRP